MITRRDFLLTGVVSGAAILPLRSSAAFTDPESAAADADCVVIITDHAAFDYKGLVERSRLIVDTRNALKGIESDKIVRL